MQKMNFRLLKILNPVTTADLLLPVLLAEVVFLLLVTCFDLFLTKLSPLLQTKKEDRYKTTGNRAVCCLERVRIQHVSLKIELYVETMPTS